MTSAPRTITGKAFCYVRYFFSFDLAASGFSAESFLTSSLQSQRLSRSPQERVVSNFQLCAGKLMQNNSLQHVVPSKNGAIACRDILACVLRHKREPFS